jgi:hypothetical protein
MPEAAPAGGAAPAPRVVTEDGPPGTRLTVADLADSAAVHAAEARQAADDAEASLEFTREHAAGMIEGAEQALANAQAAAEDAEARAAEAAAAAGREA